MNIGRDSQHVGTTCLPVDGHGLGA